MNSIIEHERETTATVEVPAAPRTRPQVRRVPSRRRPGTHGDRFRGPQLRPDVFVRAGAGPARPVSPSTAACVVEREPHWRLTDRGIAVILVTGLMVVVAAVTVVAATAVHVTSDSYGPNITALATGR